MKFATVFLLIAISLFSSCDRSKGTVAERERAIPVKAASPLYAPAPAARPTQGGGGSGEAAILVEPVKLDVADKALVPTIPTDRKVIQNGEMTIELSDPADAQRRIAAIAGSLGGFVVTSESKQSDSDVQRSRLTVTVIVRVPSSQFEAAMEKIRGIGSGARILHEKHTGQDVTEEFIDVEARIRAKKALEAQFMEIMKRAQKISDALEVQSQLAEVRGEIEQLEGRRRFLENQSALSTITINLQTPALLIAASAPGFWHSLKEAFSDGQTGATEIILGVVRIVVVLLPILLFIVLPMWLVWRFALRRVVKEWLRKPVFTSTQS